MRLLVALFLVIGFGTLRVASTTHAPGWAWVSAGVSLAALAMLVADWRRRSAARVLERTADDHASDGVEIADSPAHQSASAPPSASAANALPESGDRVSGSESTSNGSVVGQPSDRSGPVVDARRSQEEPVRPSDPGRADDDSVPADGGSLSDFRAARPVGVVGPSGSGDLEREHSADGQAGAGGPWVAEPVRPRSASLFTPYTEVEEVPADADSHVAPVFEQTGSGASDATVIFARVPDAGAAAGGPVPRGDEAGSPEPGVERADERATSVVALLDDEVLVIDELPRYHLAGCRSLGGRATIALAVRDAVELEFSPCEACSPVRRLSGEAAKRTAQSPRAGTRMLSGAQPE